MTSSSDPNPTANAGSRSATSRDDSKPPEPSAVSGRAGPSADFDPADHAELVHETRKTIKRMRALARLLRHEVGEAEFDRVNASLRAAGQRLAGARDAEVRLATLERLSARHPQALALGGIELLRTRLEHERARGGGQTGGRADRRAGARTDGRTGAQARGRTGAQAGGSSSEHEVLGEVLGDIADMRRNLSRWNLLDHDFERLAPGLRRIYREGRRRHARVRRERARKAEDLHDWRKRVKSLYYALDMLGGASAKRTRGVTRRAERLGDMLGEEHDLWMLALYVEQHPDAFGGDDRAREVLLKLTERRRKRLRKRALAAGARLYGDRPGRFTRHVGDALSR